MKFHKIPKVDKNTCTAEQMIAYNFAFRYRDFDGQKELYDLLRVVAADIKVNEKMMQRYDIDSIIHCLRNGYIDYRRNYPSILTDYETIGKIFFSTYPVQ